MTFVSAAWPSLTTSEIVCEPIFKDRFVATTLVAKGVLEPSANQEKAKGSFSTSEECEPSKYTVASVLFREMTKTFVSSGKRDTSGKARATAIGGSLTANTLIRKL